MPIKPFNPAGLTPIDRLQQSMIQADYAENPLEAVVPFVGDHPGLLYSLVAATTTNSIMGAAATDTLPYLGSMAMASDDRDPDFDVRALVTDEFLSNHPYMAEPLAAGALDDVPNLERFNLFLERQSRDAAMRDALGAHSMPMQFALSVPGQVLDLASGGILLRGLGLGGKIAAAAGKVREASLGVRVASGASLGAATNLMQELALMGLNPNRNVDNSTALMWSAGMGATFGAAVPAMAGGKNKIGGILSSARLDRMEREVAEALRNPLANDLLDQIADDAAKLKEILEEVGPTPGPLVDVDAAGTETVRQVMFLRTPETEPLIEAVKAKHGARVEFLEHPQQQEADWLQDLKRLEASLKDAVPADLGPIRNKIAGVLGSGIPVHGLNIPGAVAGSSPSAIARRAARLWFDFSRPTQETLDKPATVKNLAPAEGLKWNYDQARDVAVMNVDAALRQGLKGGGLTYRMASGEVVTISNRITGQRKFFRAVVDHLRQVDEHKRGHRAAPEAPEAVRAAAKSVRVYAQRMGTEALGVNLLRELDPDRIYVPRRWRSDQIRLNRADFRERLLRQWQRNREVDYDTGAPLLPEARAVEPDVLSKRRGGALTDADVEAVFRLNPDLAKVTEADVATLGPDVLGRYLAEVDLWHQGAADSTIDTLTRVDNRHGVELGFAGGKVFQHRKLEVNETDFADYLDSDVDSLLAFYHRQTAGKIASRTAIKRDIETWEPIVLERTGESLIANNYDPALIIRAVGADFQKWLDATAGNRPLQESIELAMHRSIGEKQGILVHKLAELEGRPVFPGDSATGAGWKLWAERQSLRMPFMAYLGKMAVSALTDLASATFYKHLSPRRLGSMVEFVRGFAGATQKRHLEGLFVANSDLAHSLRAMELGDVGDLADSRAFGPGRVGRGLQATDTVLDWGVKRFAAATMINRWNTGMKRWTATLVMQEIIDGAQSMARVADLMAGGMDETAAVAKVFKGRIQDAQRLGRLGFNAERSGRLVAMLEKHGVYRDGVDVSTRNGGRIMPGSFVSPEFNRWWRDDADLFETLTNAVNAETMNLIIEPKLLSKPLANSVWIGRMFNQFQSFAMAWGNQLVPLAMQRPGFEILQYGGMMVALGGIVDALHNSLTGRRSFEETANLWREKPYGMLYGAVNRSGLVGWLGRPLGLLERTPFGPGRALGNTELSSMYARPDTMLAQVGPFMNWTDQVTSGVTSGFFHGDWSSRTKRQLWSATPFHNLWQLEGFNRLAEQMGYDTPIGPAPAGR